MSVVVAHEPADRARVRRLTTVAAGGFGALLLLAGSLLPWLSGSGASSIVYGASEVDGRPALGARHGLAGGDAWVTIAITVLVGLILAGFVLRWRRRWMRLALFGLSGLALAWLYVAFVTVPDVSGVRAGLGLYVAVLGALTIIAAAAVFDVDADQEYDARVRRAVKMLRSGRFIDAIVLQQSLLRACIREGGWADRFTALNALQLAWMYAELSDVVSARAVRDHAMAQVSAHLSDEGDRALIAHRAAQVDEVITAMTPYPVSQWQTDADVSFDDRR